MFDNEPSYLGGLTTQLQDSMQGIQYGRSDVNPDSKYVPNTAASGNAYREEPKQKKATMKVVPNEEDLVKQKANAEQAQRGDVFAIVQMHVDNLSNESQPREFFGLQMPSKLIESTPDIETWVASLEKMEQALQRGMPLDEQLKDPELSVARLALEFIQPGTVKMDAPSQIQRTQQLLQHLKGQAQKQEPQRAPEPKKVTFSEVIQKSTAWARENIKHPRTRIGPFSVPQFLVNQDKTGMFSEQSLTALTKALQSQLASGEELTVPEESLKVIIPILAFSNGFYPQNIQQLQQMVNKMTTPRPTPAPAPSPIPKKTVPARTAPARTAPGSNLTPLGQQMAAINANLSSLFQSAINIGPFKAPKQMSVSPQQIFEAVTTLKPKLVSREFSALPAPQDSILLLIALNRQGTQQFSPVAPGSMIPIINTMRATYLAWKRQQDAAAPVPNRTQPNRGQVTEATPQPTLPQANAPAPAKTLPSIIAASLQWAQTQTNQPMTTVGAFVFPSAFLNSSDSHMLQEPNLVEMLKLTIGELQSGKLSGNVHWDVLETMIPIIAFSIGKFPSSLAPNVAIPQLTQMAMELGQRHSAMKLRQANANTAINMPPNNNELNSNIPEYMNTNVRPNANANIVPINSNIPMNVPNANVNYPQNNVNLPNTNVEPSLVNQATEFVSSPTGMAATAIAVGLGWYLLKQRK